jgi:hydrophobic/amphiphilic exporter-1 (mainly G- bacteria), HAE1 family
MRLSDFSVDRPVTITMIVLIIVVIGLLSLSRIGLDMMPDVDFPTVSVVTRYEGAASEDIEKLITRTIEGAAASVSGVSNVKSISREDQSFVLVSFEWGTDLDSGAQDLREALGLIEPMLPNDADKPMVLKFSLTALPVLSYLVVGMDGNPTALNQWLDDTLVPRIERVDGVAGVVAMGGLEREVQISVRRSALEATGLSLQAVQQALFAQNMNLPGGRVVQERSEYLLRTLGEFEDLDGIRNSMVGMTQSGQPVLVKDVADVRFGYADVRNEIRTLDQSAIYLMVNKRSGANPLKTAQGVKEELDRIQKELPGDIEFHLVMDTGRNIELMTTNVLTSGLAGGLLAIMFMFLFLRSLRPTLAIAVAIPLSLLVTFIPIYIIGETLNLMTMGGLMLGIGMLVDNAVVVIENIFRHLEAGAERKQAAREGAREIAMAITASTLTTVAVFLPLFFGGGLAGELVRGLAIVVAFALAASLLVALTIVPMLASVFFSKTEAKRAGEASVRFKRFQGRYERTLRWVLGHRKTTFALISVLVIGSLALLPMAGATFMPASDQPMVMGLVKFPVGTPYPETDRAVRRIASFARSLPGVQTVGTSVGVNEDDMGAGLSDMSPKGVNEAQLFLRLQDERDTSTAEMLTLLRDGAPNVEGMTVEFFDMGGMMFGGNASKPIQIQVRGQDLIALRAKANEVAERISEVEGVTEIATSFQQAKPERHLIVDRQKAASYGLSVVEIGRAVEAASSGAVAGQYRLRGEEFLIRVRYEAGDRATFDDLDRILIPTRAGFSLPLRQVARFEKGEGPVQIDRENQARQVTVFAGLEGRDLGSVFADIDIALQPVKDNLPLGYNVEYGGQYEDMVEAFVSLLGALMLAILLVYMVMASQFEAFVHPLVILFTLPLSIIGVAVTLVLSGTPVSVVTFVGVIMLAGIVVNNGIVLVDYINQLRRDGMERREAIVTGGVTRLRAVLITSGTTISGLLPMALLPGRGSELTGDMAATVAGGLAAAATLTLLVVPLLYEWFDDLGNWGRNRLGGVLHRADNAAAEQQANEDVVEAAREGDGLLFPEGSPA